jgi:ABC-type uncharacterized transport system ATPase subunit
MADFALDIGCTPVNQGRSYLLGGSDGDSFFFEFIDLSSRSIATENRQIHLIYGSNVNGKFFTLHDQVMGKTTRPNSN